MELLFIRNWYIALIRILFRLIQHSKEKIKFQKFAWIIHCQAKIDRKIFIINNRHLEVIIYLLEKQQTRIFLIKDSGVSRRRKFSQLIPQKQVMWLWQLWLHLLFDVPFTTQSVSSRNQTKEQNIFFPIHSLLLCSFVLVFFAA